MKIAITGCTGLIGTELTKYFKSQGDHVVEIIRVKKEDGKRSTVYWNPDQGVVETDKLEGCDVLIHLAGENISSRRWDDKQKERILMSRTRGTTVLCHALSRLKQPPKVLLSASAIGYYGNHPASIILNEQSTKSNDFLAKVISEWESATQSAKEAGIRVVHMRFGIVLSEKGGALAKMLLPFRLGMGGRIGDGKQIMSWIALEEIPLIVQFLIKQESITGPVNIVSPYSVSNQEFTSMLGKVLHRPTILPLPAFVLRVLFGEMADSLLIKGSKVIPRKLQESGYSFAYPDLHNAFTRIFGNKKK
ncbi:hypothetical protein SAMN04487866_11181 [Thermoactinomyces sp. DSM 45891]|uniref:TIGR01777 family oxidoreductase n=1 Tax=Thermoactinomyces sp. DSM 45891 TaxID=1761907 RepID=UPI00091BEF21|nr:TIGR01777 family oxidoreductase [Thermoactinomyces sp. DSM 45891]SFX55610.1 hypothetical protein SAMN04487866_11181 [Thermoactinomyces sp. DSM 45891]